MSYIEENLLPGEEIVHKGVIHWIVYLHGFAFMILGIILMYLFSLEHFILGFYTGILFLFLGFIRILLSYIHCRFTELAVTNKRTIVKRGMVSRDVLELNHAKVESVVFEQTVLGRLLNYGILIISGTGSGKNIVPNISNPMLFKKKVLEMVDLFHNEG